MRHPRPGYKTVLTMLHNVINRVIYHVIKTSLGNHVCVWAHTIKTDILEKLFFGWHTGLNNLKMAVYHLVKCQVVTKLRVFLCISIFGLVNATSEAFRLGKYINFKHKVLNTGMVYMYYLICIIYYASLGCVIRVIVMKNSFHWPAADVIDPYMTWWYRYTCMVYKSLLN